MSVQLNYNVKLTAKGLQAEVEKALAKSILEAEAVAKNRAPVDTGKLRNGIESKVSGLEASLVSKAPYSAYVEYGTRFQRAQPFMYPALVALENLLDKELKGAFQRWNS